ncbi:hypothetical protein N665_0921s0003, partial [Sinapis alba]
RSSKDNILRQSYDDEYNLIGSRGYPFLNYLPLNTRGNTVFVFSTNLQNCFPSIAILKYVRSLKPKPPSSLRLHSLSHNVQCIPLKFPHELHQNCATTLISFFITVFGIRKQDITCFGKVVTTYLIITSFTPLVKNLKVCPFTLLFKRS